MYFTELLKPVLSHRFMLLSLIAGSSLIAACDDDDDPQRENVPELITTAELTFSPAGGGADVVATATDPDGEGIQDIEVDGPIDLAANTTYTLTIRLYNDLAQPTDPEYNVHEEVEEEGLEHMFFFGWTTDLFSDPAGNGNIDNRSDAVNYEDEDDAGEPIGLTTTWTTGDAGAGTLRIMLKHQPDLKSSTTTSEDGETDVDLTFDVNIE